MTLVVESRNTQTPGTAAPGRSTSSVAGMAAGVSASLVWGTAFLVPVLLSGWNPVIVTLGRYLVYGLLAGVLLAVGGTGPRRVLREHWRIALGFALAGNVIYYLLLVIGIRAAGAPLTDMVIGAIPVVVAVTGNVLAPTEDGVPWRRLALPLTLVTAGLALVSALEIAGVHAYVAASPAEKIAGLLAAAAPSSCGPGTPWPTPGSWPATIRSPRPAGPPPSASPPVRWRWPGCPLPRSPASSPRPLARTPVRPRWSPGSSSSASWSPGSARRCGTWPRAGCRPPWPGCWSTSRP